MKKLAPLLLAVLLTGCVTHIDHSPVNLSLIPKKKPTLVLYSGIKNFDVVDVTNNVYRGAQPTDKNDWLYLRDRCHVTAVLKLDTDSEGSDAEAELLGLHVIKIPIPLKEQLFGPVPSKEIIAAFKQNHTHLYIHCVHGQDRTGLACYLYNLFYQKQSHNEAEKDMLSHGFHKILWGLWTESQKY